MKAEMIDALELLRSQHTEVESLIDDVQRSDDRDEKIGLFRRLADHLAAHAKIEETLFYPSVMHPTTEELVVESTEEHLSVKRLLADMLALDVEDEHFDAKLTVLKEQVRHHARDEEEDQLFPLVEELFDEEERAALGNELLAMFESLIERDPRTQVPQETHEAARLSV